MRITDILERPQSRQLLADWYRSALEDQETSGLSISEYADELGVSAATLYQWRRRLAHGSESVRDRTLNSARLVEVIQARPEHPARPAATIFVRLARDLSIEVPYGFDESELRRLVAALELC